MCVANDMPIVVIKEGEYAPEKILLVRKQGELTIRLIESEVNKFFPKTISLVDRLFKRAKYKIHTCHKMVSVQFDGAIQDMLKISDWDFCALEIYGDKVISRYMHNSVIMRNEHNITTCKAISVDDGLIDYVKKRAAEQLVAI